jgi:hypothetical protein
LKFTAGNPPNTTVTPNYTGFIDQIIAQGVQQAASDDNPTVSFEQKLNNFGNLASSFDISNSVNEWTIDDIIKWKAPVVGDPEYIFEFKEQWINGYKDVIKDAAKQSNIPEFLLAGVAYAEVGGDPIWIDEIAYQVREFDHLGNPILEPLTITNEPELTSFGNVSIQLRRAAETLGYDYHNLSNEQVDSLKTSILDPKQNIYLVAEHLSDLKNIDFSEIDSDNLTKEQIEIIATRYNRGPDLSLEEIKQNSSYGKSITNRTEIILQAIK